MRVLHLYSQKMPMLAQYVSMLTRHYKDTQSTDNPKLFRQMCQELHPDIVHFHGCSDSEVIKSALWARQHDMRIVLTPHGELEPWVTKHSLLQKNLRSLVPHAYAVIARSNMEAKTLAELDWNPRVEIVLNPLITRTTTTDDLQSAHQRIYEKVMDSNVLEIMDAPTLLAFHTLLKAGITLDDRWVKPFDMDSVNWKHLFIYAHHERVKSCIDRGLITMRIIAPDVSMTSGYLPNNYSLPKPMGNIPLTDMVKSIYRQYQKKQIPLLSLVEIDQALRHDDVEDDLLMQQLTADKLDSFLASLLPVVQEQTGLDEGFMPCPSKETSVTKKIRRIINKHLEI